MGFDDDVLVESSNQVVESYDNNELEQEEKYEEAKDDLEVLNYPICEIG